MIIEAKGTRQDAPQADASQRYRLKGVETKSRTPFTIGLIVTGLAFYLKSIFPALAEPEGRDGKAGAGDDGARPPAADQQAPAAPEPVPAEPAETPGEAASAAALAIRSEGRVAAGQQGAGGLTPDGPRAEGSFDRPDHGIAGPGSTTAGERAGSPGAGQPAGGKPWRKASADADGDAGDEERGRTANRAPQASGPMQLLDVASGGLLAFALADLLRNVSDPDGDPLAVSDVAISSGTLARFGDGWIVQFDPEFLGAVTLTYQVTDGALTIERTTTFEVVRHPFDGSDRDDTVIATVHADAIDAMAGDDVVDARAGDDVVSAGAGDDQIVAGDGDDLVFAGAGDDIVLGGGGNDRIIGGQGDDRLYGDDGDDVVTGNAGHDAISGGAGADALGGGAGDDHLSGGDGDDHLVGGTGDDRLDGGAGDDLLSDGRGQDDVQGGSGADRVVAALDGAADRLDGGDGLDTLDYSRATEAVTVDLAAGSASGAEIGEDRIASFEKLVGGAGDDLLSDGRGQDDVQGGSGADRVVAALDGAADRLDGGDGLDTLDYSRATEAVTVDLVAGAASGAEIGEDRIASFENLVGGSGDDHFVCDVAVPSLLTGGDGDDTFEFPPAPEPLADAPAWHAVLDFAVGDRIRISKYDLFERGPHEVGDRFREIFGDDADRDDMPIRYRHDRTDELSRTVVEANFDNDDVWEITIALEGHRILVVSEHG